MASHSYPSGLIEILNASYSYLSGLIRIITSSHSYHLNNKIIISYVKLCFLQPSRTQTVFKSIFSHTYIKKICVMPLRFQVTLLTSANL
jgi:hypothetical protein